MDIGVCSGGPPRRGPAWVVVGGAPHCTLPGCRSTRGRACVLGRVEAQSVTSDSINGLAKEATQRSEARIQIAKPSDIGGPNMNAHNNNRDAAASKIDEPHQP